MASAPTDEESLRESIERIRGTAEAKKVAVAFHDYRTGKAFTHKAHEWFHAASTIKIPVLLGVFAAIEAGELTLASRLHVRNRFLSAIDGEPYRVQAGRDANSAVHARIGKTMRVDELAKHMIVTSSNLATNLLVDFIGVERVQRTLSELGVDGIELRRGVEDERAYEEGINNRVTASGLVQVLRLIEEGQALSKSACDQMLDILHQQEFRSGIPAGLPDSARVANKTGEISTAAHDAGLVYLRDREPYAITILTEWDPNRSSGRREAVANISRSVYKYLTREGS